MPATSVTVGRNSGFLFIDHTLPDFTKGELLHVLPLSARVTSIRDVFFFLNSSVLPQHMFCDVFKPKALNPRDTGVHLALSYRDLADSDLAPICLVIKGDYSVISALDSYASASSVGGDIASAAGQDRIIEEIGGAGVSSLDLSGNRITDVGVERIAACLNSSSVRFVALKFNPCQAMPLLTSDVAWSSCARDACSRLKPTIGIPTQLAERGQCSRGNTCVYPADFFPFVSAFSVTRAQTDKGKSDMYFIGSATSGKAARNISGDPERPRRERISAKRYKGNAVHPE